MTKKRATMKDIADEMEVSVVTVHNALLGKSGVSEETRRAVCESAKRLHYSTNEAASALKRGTRTLAVVLPRADLPDGYFYRAMWQAVRDTATELENFNITVREYPCDNTWKSQAEALEMASQNGADGVIVANSLDQTKLNAGIAALAEKNVPVITVNSDAYGSKRLRCVCAPNERAGRLAAEYIAGGMPQEKCSVLVLGGSMNSAVHRETVSGFTAQLHALRPFANAIVLYDEDDVSLIHRVKMAFQDTPNLYGAYSTSARNTILMCRLVQSEFPGGKVLLGSDVFTELLPYFASGTLNATVWKDPYSQIRQAMFAIYHHLAGHPQKEERVRIGLIFSNNAEDYL